MAYELTDDDLAYYLKFARKFALRYYEKFYLNAIISLDDMIQEGMLGLMDAISRYDPDRDATFKAYANTRISGAIIDYIRREFPYLALTHPIGEDVEDTKPSPERQTVNLTNMESRVLVRDILSKIDDVDKLILYLLYFDDFSIREVGSLVDVPKSTIHTIHRAILSKIQQRINPQIEVVLE